MKYPSTKAVLISIFFNLVFISMIFARENLTSLKIQEGIDQIWTTGHLDIGSANIASKLILPRLYEKNDFQLLWQNLQNVTDLLNELKHKRYIRQRRRGSERVKPRIYYVARTVFRLIQHHKEV